MGETPVAKKAMAVVKEVLKMAEAARRCVKVRREVIETETGGGMLADCRHASTKTKMSSAPTPSTTKTERMCTCRRPEGGGWELGAEVRERRGVGVACGVGVGREGGGGRERGWRGACENHVTRRRA